MESKTLSISFARLIRVFAGISILPALFLPFYQAFLHGGRSAVEIIPRSGAYTQAHMIGAFCILLASFGLISLYLRYNERMGWIAPFSLALMLLAQTSYAGVLFIDGFFNPVLAHFDPLIQTIFHSGDVSGAVAQSPILQQMGIGLFTPVLISIVYILANILLGILILWKRFLPFPIAILFMIGGLILGFALYVPIWVEVIGYATEGVAIAWSAYLAFRDSSLSRSV